MLGIYASFLLAIMFLFLPTFVTGSLYGPDSYTKAAGVNRILQTHHVNFNIYPAAEVFSSVAILITNLSIISTPLKLGAAVLSPLITYATVSSLNNGSYGLPARWVLVLSSLLPLGMGMWLSTRSTYHNFFLTLPVAVLMLFSFIRFKSQSDFRWAVLFAGIGLALLLYHPLGLISIIGAILIVDIITFDSLNLYTLLPLVRDKNPTQKTIFVVLLTAIYFIVFSYFQLLPPGKTNLINKLILIDILNFDATTNTLSVSIFDSQSSVSCGTEGFFNRCGWRWAVGNKVFALTTLAISTSLTATIGLRWFYEDIVENKVSHKTVLALSLFIYIVFSLMTMGISIIGRNISIRLLGVNSIIGIILIAWYWKKQSKAHLDVISTIILINIIVLALAILTLVYPMPSATGKVVAFLISAIAFFSIITTVDSSRGVHLAGIVCIALLVFSFLLIYPIPSTNGVPNQAITDSDEEQVRWANSYSTAESDFAAGMSSWRINEYQNPTGDVQQFQGSQWRLGKLWNRPGHEVTSMGGAYPTLAVSSTADYILITQFDNHYLTATYRSDNKTYNGIISINEYDVRHKHPFAQKVYSSKNTSNNIYRIK